MEKREQIHYELICAQIDSLFKYHNEKAAFKWQMADYQPLTIDGKNIITYSLVNDPDTNSQRKFVIDVDIEGERYSFYQNYRYGVMLDGGVTHKEIKASKGLIDLEMALSLVTENLASQLTINES